MWIENPCELKDLQYFDRITPSLVSLNGLPSS